MEQITTGLNYAACRHYHSIVYKHVVYGYIAFPVPNSLLHLSTFQNIAIININNYDMALGLY